MNQPMAVVMMMMMMLTIMQHMIMHAGRNSITSNQGLSVVLSFGDLMLVPPLHYLGLVMVMITGFILNNDNIQMILLFSTIAMTMALALMAVTVIFA